MRGEGATLNGLWIMHHLWGQYAKAVEFYDRSLAIQRKIGDVQGEGRTLGSLGNVHYDLGQYQKAVEFYDRSLAIQRQIGDIKGEASALHNLANVSYSRGQYAKAVEFYDKSLAVKSMIGDLKNEGVTLVALGNVYKNWGQYAKALEFCDRSMAIARKLGDVKTEAHALNSLGSVHRARGEYEKALENFQRGREICHRIGIPTEGPTDNIGNLYLDTEQVQKAEPFIVNGNFTSSLGRLALMKGDCSSAKVYYERLLTSAEQNRHADNLFTAYTGLGACWEGLADDNKAAEHYRKAIEHTEDLRSSLSPTERETFFDVRIAGFYRTAPYEGLARVLTKLNRPVEAFKESEYAKARMFVEAISKRGGYAGHDIPKAVRDEDASLTDQLSALSKNLQAAYEKGNREVIASLEPQVKEAKQKLASHVDMLRKEHPLFAATRYPQPMNLDKTALQDNEWVLAYHVTDPGLIVYLTKGKKLIKSVFKPVPRKEIDELVRKFREPLEMAGGEIDREKLVAFDFASGKKLSDVLLGDVLSELPKDAPIIVVPDDSLGVVPFEMLVLNDGGKTATEGKVPMTVGAEFFGDRNPISYYQSVTALTLARTFGASKASEKKVLVMDDPVFEPDDPRLKQAALAERRKLLASLPDQLQSIKTELNITFPRLPLTSDLGKSLKKLDPGKTEEYTGMEASKSLLFNKPLDNFGSMIFATHGYFGKELPGIMEPVLVLTLVDQPEGQDGFLRLSEVMGLKIDADMVALTACQTGLGRRISGEGTMGMGRAFQHAGAKSVLMSLWSVSETSSVKLVESFFRNLKEGKPKLEALRLARKEIRDQGYDHPFFWAPFILVGEVE